MHDCSRERGIRHDFKSAISSVGRIEMPPKLGALKVDETTACGLRLMRCFLRLREQRHRDELIAMAERLVEKEEEYPVEPGE
jgi:hypothetical protein